MFNRINDDLLSMDNISVQQHQTTWRDFASVKTWRKQLRKRSKKKELSVKTWANAEMYFPKFLKLCKKTPDELIEEALVDSDIAEERIDDFFQLLKQTISHNSARIMCYGLVQGFYSHNKIITKSWTCPEPTPSLVKDVDDNFPVWVYNEHDDDFELDRTLFQDFFNRLSPTYRAVAYAIIGTGQDIGIILKRNVGFVRNQDPRHKRLSLNDNRSKTSEIIDGFYSEEATNAARSILAAEKEGVDDKAPLYSTSIAQRKREFRKIHGRQFRNDGIDVLPPAKRLTVSVVEIAFRKAQRAMGIKLIKKQQGPLRPKRLRKIYRTAADLAGLNDDKARQLLGQSTRSSGVYLETAREIQERTYMKVEGRIWIFKEPQLSVKEKETSKDLKKQIDEMKRKQAEDKEEMLEMLSEKFDQMREDGYIPK